MARLRTDPAESSFNAALRKRLRELRRRRGWTQADMARALGIEEDRYRKYESRSPIPIFYLSRIALFCGASIEWIVTGQEAGRKRPVGVPGEQKD